MTSIGAKFDTKKAKLHKQQLFSIWGIRTPGYASNLRGYNYVMSNFTDFFWFGVRQIPYHRFDLGVREYQKIDDRDLDD